MVVFAQPDAGTPNEPEQRVAEAVEFALPVALELALPVALELARAAAALEDLLHEREIWGLAFGLSLHDQPLQSPPHGLA